jgi:hypothetical protein
MHTIKSRPCTNNDNPLYKMGPNGVLCQCSAPSEAEQITLHPNGNIKTKQIIIMTRMFH